MVLHTHARDLSYHPHIHALIPGGGINTKLCRWIRVEKQYLFNGLALAKNYRGKFLDLLRSTSLPIPNRLPGKWVAHCKHIGSGMPALKYLARYLYRGVISENDIVANSHGKITFRYRDSKTGEFRYKTVKGEDFLHLLLKHVMPRGFRRTRDYGFLHGNAKKIRALIQLISHVFARAKPGVRPRPSFVCPNCRAAMVALRFCFDYGRSG